MNIDRCHDHVPTSPGQSVCSCLDYIMWARFVIDVQAQVIADLNRQLHGTTDVTYCRGADGTTTSTRR